MDLNTLFEEYTLKSILREAVMTGNQDVYDGSPLAIRLRESTNVHSHSYATVVDQLVLLVGALQRRCYTLENEIKTVRTALDSNEQRRQSDAMHAVDWFHHGRRLTSFYDLLHAAGTQMSHGTGAMVAHVVLTTMPDLLIYTSSGVRIGRADEAADLADLFTSKAYGYRALVSDDELAQFKVHVATFVASLRESDSRARPAGA